MKRLRLTDYFATSELSLSAALICLGYTPDSLDKTQNKITFIFSRSEELDKAVQAFWRRELKIEPLAYFEAQRYLKSRIYGEEK